MPSEREEKSFENGKLLLSTFSASGIANDFRLSSRERLVSLYFRQRGWLTGEDPRGERVSAVTGHCDLIDCSIKSKIVALQVKRNTLL